VAGDVPTNLANPAPARYQAHEAAIAQSVEHIIRNDGVGGSNPSCGTVAPRTGTFGERGTYQCGEVTTNLYFRRRPGWGGYDGDCNLATAALP
jgi:hypothetical protein